MRIISSTAFQHGINIGASHYDQTMTDKLPLTQADGCAMQNVTRHEPMAI